MTKLILRPCPFCGGKASMFTVKADGAPPRYEVDCENKGCEVASCTMLYDTPEEAAAIWNRRHYED